MTLLKTSGSSATKRWLFYPDLPTARNGTGADRTRYRRGADTWLKPWAVSARVAGFFSPLTMTVPRPLPAAGGGG